MRWDFFVFGLLNFSGQYTILKQSEPPFGGLSSPRSRLARPIDLSGSVAVRQSKGPKLRLRLRAIPKVLKAEKGRTKPLAKSANHVSQSSLLG